VTGQDAASTGALRLPRLDRIRTKLLVFAVVIAILPALVTGWVSYTSSKRAVRDRIGRDLESGAQQAARETDLWLKERLFDLGVYARSQEVTGNLERNRRSGSVPAGSRLSDYLDRVRGKFPDYLELQALTLDGRMVASSPASATPLSLATAQAEALGAGQPAFGDVVVDSVSGIRSPSPSPSRPRTGACGLVTYPLPADSLGELLDITAGRRQPTAWRIGAARPFPEAPGQPGVDSAASRRCCRVGPGCASSRIGAANPCRRRSADPHEPLRDGGTPRTSPTAS
jgi:hypothetical protein